MAETRIAELSSQIASNVSKIDTYLASQNESSPSFDSSITSALFSDDSLAPARRELLEATHELHQLMQGPLGVFTSSAFIQNIMMTWQAVYRFNIATSFENEATYKEIATACGLTESITVRLVRSAMASHVFRESKPGYVVHTAASKMLATNPAMHDWIGFVAEELWPSSTKQVDALEKWPGSEEPNQAGFNVSSGSEKDFFTDVASDPVRFGRVAKAMDLFSQDKGHSPSHLIENYPWSKIGKGTVVDVGGSFGAYSIPIAQHFPAIRCIIQDRPEVAAAGSKGVPAELTDRVTYMAHDFFEVQPVKDADVYLFRWIFHDWSDKYATRIIKALVPALKKGAKILVLDYVLPEPGTVPYYQERILRAFDTQMMCLSARERGAEDFRMLFHGADPRFKFVCVKQPPASQLGFIEVEWTGE